MPSGHYRHKPARGAPDARGMLRITCAFDEDTFEALARRAAHERTSFVEQVQLLVEWGLEAAEGAEREAAD